MIEHTAKRRCLSRYDGAAPTVRALIDLAVTLRQT